MKSESRVMSKQCFDIPCLIPEGPNRAPGLYEVPSRSMSTASVMTRYIAQTCIKGCANERDVVCNIFVGKALIVWHSAKSRYAREDRIGLEVFK